MFVDAINNSDTNSVLRLLGAEEDKIDLNTFKNECSKLGLGWVIDAMAKDVKLTLNGVSRHRKKVVVKFGIYELGNSKGTPRQNRRVSAFFLDGKFSGETGRANSSLLSAAPFGLPRDAGAKINVEEKSVHK
jgi:hypothetical protein